MTTLVRAERDDDHLENLGERLVGLEKLLDSRTAEGRCRTIRARAFRLR